MEKKKRERGANYTAEEKTLLAELVTKYKHIIEDKRTGGILINKKKEAWKIITVKYNSNCTTPRETEQLKSLYDNMKQKSRKIVAENNKIEYMKSKENEIVTQEDLKKALENIKEDKVQMNKTGGGFWKPKSSDCDSKILAVIQAQVEPLPNPYDSAAAYFKEIDNLHVEDHSTSLASTSQETNDKNLFCPYLSDLGQHNMYDTSNIELNPAQSIVVQKDQDQEEQTKNITKKVSQGRVVKKKQVPKKIKKDTSAEALKRLYFKKKCQNAQLERKKLSLDILYMKQQNNLKIEILKGQLNNNK